MTSTQLECEPCRRISEPRLWTTYLKLWYNGYVFSHGSKTMYNPQQVFTYLGHIISGWEPLTRTGEANAAHTGKILSLVGKTGAVTIYDLVSMLSTKVANANAEFSFLELMQAQEERCQDPGLDKLYSTLQLRCMTSRSSICAFLYTIMDRCIASGFERVCFKANCVTIVLFIPHSRSPFSISMKDLGYRPSGHWINFYTGATLLNGRSTTSFSHTFIAFSQRSLL